jgi:putative peptidoglycan lipid II flippase
VQLAFQIPFLRSLRMLPRPRLALRTQHDGVNRVFTLMLPAIFGVSIAQINLLVNTLLASYLVTGSVSWLYYSDRLMEFPLGVFGIALATVILPQLARQHTDASHENFSHLLDWGLRWVFLISLPASVALVVLSGPLLATLFYHGAFSERDVAMSAQALIAFSAGLVGFVLVKVLAPGFYARHDTKTPMRIGVISMVTNVAASLVLVRPFAHVGLATAVSIAAFVNAGLLFHLLRRQGVYRPLPGWGKFLTRTAFASAAMGVVVFWGAGELVTWLQAGVVERVWRLCWWVFAGIVTYFLALLAMGIRPRELLLRRKDGNPDV